MPRSETDRVVLGRSIRAHILSWQDRRGPGSTPTGAKNELFKAAAELTVLINMEYPEGGSDERCGVHPHPQVG